MGCDIHGPYVEVSSDGKDWSLVAEFQIHRDYSLFALLADVRNGEGLKHLKVKGCPTNLSWNLRDAALCSDLHSHSWLDLKEAKEFLKTYEDYLRGPDTEKMRAFFSKQVDWCKERGTDVPRWESYDPMLSANYQAFKVMIAAMEKFLEVPGYRHCRMVFWFDN